MTPEKGFRAHVRRPPSTATWEHQHRWGPQLSDNRPLRVQRVDGGEMSIKYGTDEVVIPGDLVPMLAEMVALASRWADESFRPDSGGAA